MASTTGDVSIDNFEVRDGCSLDLSGTLTANPSCNGETDGAIVAQVENANGPVLYRLGTSGAFDTIVEFNDLSAGAYTLFARDSFNCETSLVITLTEPAVISTTATIANATCYGAATGTIELIPTGGTAPYSYEWSNAADTTFMETTRNVDSLLAGTYVVDITDARGCTHSATYVVGQAPEIVATTVSRSTVTCIAQDGSIVLGVSGGTGAKSIVWNTTPVQTGLTASGLAVVSHTATIIIVQTVVWWHTPSSFSLQTLWVVRRQKLMMYHVGARLRTSTSGVQIRHRLCNQPWILCAEPTDDCGYTMTRTSGMASGSTFPVGVTTVTHAFADASGNTVNHSFTVTVVDGAPTLPTLGAYCPSDAVVNLTSGQAGLVFAGPVVAN